MAKGDTKTNQYLDIAANGTRADLPSDTCCETRSQTLIREVAERIIDVEDEVEELKNNPDVVDIVATYADLQAYDTQHLTDKDIIRVLQDETHDGESTYYRYNKQSDTWTYIGESKQYDDFVGTDGTTAGEAGLVPAPATTDAGKYLKSDGTWGTVQAGPTVVQTTGNSTTDVMSQDATTGLVYAETTGKYLIRIGDNATTSTNTGDENISIGVYAKASGYSAIALGGHSRAEKNYNIAIGRSANAYNGANEIAIGYNSGSTTSGSTRNISIGGSAQATSTDSVAIGYGAKAQYGTSAVALGAGAKATQKGQFDISAGTSGTDGYNNTFYRLITGVHDGQSAHDAATVAQGNTLASSAPTTSTVGVLGQLYTDTTDMHTYQCTAISGNTYTWTQRW